MLVSKLAISRCEKMTSGEMGHTQSQEPGVSIEFKLPAAKGLRGNTASETTRSDNMNLSGSLSVRNWLHCFAQGKEPNSTRES